MYIVYKYIQYTRWYYKGGKNMNKTKLMDFNENIQYKFHTNICECDMVAASVSVCERYKLLTNEKIEWLKLLPKEKRTVEMGKMQKDKSFSDKMISGLLETRDIFINENHITDDDIISLHSDALFIINKNNIKTKVNGIDFKIKNTYTSYVKYDERMEMFYTGKYIDFKQFNKERLKDHTLGIVKYLTNVFNKIENYDPTILDYMRKTNTRYLKDKLPEYWYRSFGNVGEYKTENFKLFAYMTNIVLNEVRRW